MFDVEAFKKAYPDWFQPTSALDVILGVLAFSMLFIIPFIYVRFIEDRLVFFVLYRLIPFIRYKMHLEKLIEIMDRILKYQIFGNPRTKV